MRKYFVRKVRLAVDPRIGKMIEFVTDISDIGWERCSYAEGEKGCRGHVIFWASFI